MNDVVLGTAGVTAEEVCAVARGNARVVISSDALETMERARSVIERLAAADTPAYGVSTGFGALANRHISPAQRAQLQRSLVRSHAAGMGPDERALQLRTLSR